MRRLIATLLVVVVLAGCGSGVQASVSDLIKKWKENDITTIMHAMFGTSTGHKGQDGLIDGIKNIDDQDGATKQALAARDSGDTATLDTLVAKYPNDYSLKAMRGVAELANGDTRGFVSDYAAADTPGQQAGIDTKIEQLVGISDKIVGNFKNRNQCDEYYGSLSQLFRQRFEFTKDQSDLDFAAKFDQTHTQTCPGLPAG